MKRSFITDKILLLSVLFGLLLFTALSAAAQQGLPENEKDTYTKAVQELKSGSYDLALNLFNTSLRIRIEKNGSNSVPVANVLTNLGVIKSQLGSYDQAIEYYQKAATIYFQEGDNKLKQLASVQQNLAICFSEKGDFEKARSYYENSERIYRTLMLENSADYEDLLINQTLLFINYNDLAKAEELNNSALGIKTLKKSEFNKWNNKGLIFFKKKNYIQSMVPGFAA